MTPEQAAQKYPHIIQIGSDGIPELFADNHILSHLRLCEAFFVESFLNNLHQKGERSWSLEFGIWFHKVTEAFYNNTTPFTNCPDLVTYASEVWMQNDMQYFNTKPEYYKVCAKIGGLTGAIQLVVDYWRMYGEGKDTLKVIGTELSFGRGKEVPILDNKLLTAALPFRAYYCGRMDAIGDDGTSIFPVDHKTTSTINPLTTGRDFKPHDGMQGYVYSLSHIAKSYFPTLQRACNKAMVNHVQVNYSADYTKRFKRTTLHYSPLELEAWRVRQIRSFRKLWEIAVEEQQPDWNTSSCHDIYNYPCPFRLLHEQDPINREAYLAAHYVTIEPWNTAEVDGLRKVQNG
jgi:hypothetical protein